jgi:hypothetical protein
VCLVLLVLQNQSNSAALLSTLEQQITQYLP